MSRYEPSPVSGNSGADGADGEDGAPGVGVPPGGALNEVLAKASGADFDTHWTGQLGGGGGLPTAAGAGKTLRSTASGGAIWVDEGPLQFTDPRVGGVLDDGSTDNGAPTPSGFTDGLSATARATALLRSGGPGGELHIGAGGRQAILGTSRPIVIPNNCILTMETVDHGSSASPAYDQSTPPFRFGTVIRAINGSTQAFAGGPYSCLVQLGEDYDFTPPTTTATRRRSGNAGAVLQNCTIDAAGRADAALAVVGHRTMVSHCAIHRGALYGISWVGQGGLLDGGWVGGNAGAGVALFYHGNDLHVTGGVRMGNATTAIRSNCGGLYLVGPNHLFLGNDAQGAPAGSRIIDLVAVIDHEFIVIVGNVIENCAVEQIRIKPTAGAAYHGIFIMSNMFYQHLWTPDLNSTVVIDATDGSVRGFKFSNNGIAYDSRAKALIDCKPGSVIDTWDVSGNTCSKAQSVFTAGSVLPDGDRSGNTINTGSNANTARFSERKATVGVTSNGAAVVIIPHLLGTAAGQIPRYATATPADSATADAGVRYVNADATNLTIGLNTAPASGTPLTYSIEVAL